MELKNNRLDMEISIIFYFLTPRENPRRGPRYKSGAFSTLGRSLGFSSGGLKENSQNPDTVEAKTVKTKIKTKSGKKWGKFPFRVTTLSAYKSGLKWTFGPFSVPNISVWPYSSCRKRIWVIRAPWGRAMTV